MLTPADVGRRVVVRRALGEEAGRQTYGDVLGQLVSWRDGVLVVRRADGQLVEIRERDVVAGKAVPPAPARRAAPETGDALTLVAARGWPAVEVDRLGEWWLQAAGGFTGRANCALPVGDPGRALPAALDDVRAFYDARRLPPLLRVVADSALESRLDRLGWRVQPGGRDGAYATTWLQTAPLPAVLDRLAARPHGPAGPGGDGGQGEPAVSLGGPLDAAWMTVYGRGDAQDPAVRQVLTGAATSVLARVDGASLRAIGHAVVTGSWLGVAALEVVEGARGAGLGTAVMAALCRWGREQGARRAYLQVGADNAVAARWYARMGFRTDHAYRYYTPVD